MASSLDSHSSSHSRTLLPVLPTSYSSDEEDSTVGSHGSVEVDYTILHVYILFSKAGVILSQRRSRLNSDKLEKLVFIK